MIVVCCSDLRFSSWHVPFLLALDHSYLLLLDPMCVCVCVCLDELMWAVMDRTKSSYIVCGQDAGLCIEARRRSLFCDFFFVSTSDHSPFVLTHIFCELPTFWGGRKLRQIPKTKWQISKKRVIPSQPCQGVVQLSKESEICIESKRIVVQFKEICIKSKRNMY